MQFEHGARVRPLLQGGKQFLARGRISADRGYRIMSKGRQGQFRIIGGQWRGRRLYFPDRGGVRPTPDRVRETLFNWLGQALAGQHFLDLFAGAGALGLEALSRGAAGGCFVERDRRLVAAIRGHLETLGASAPAKVVAGSLPGWLTTTQPTLCDLVFLDPPWDAGLHEPVLRGLVEGQCLHPRARIYVEWRDRAGVPELPEPLVWDRQSKAGEAGFGLAVRGN